MFTVPEINLSLIPMKTGIQILFMSSANAVLDTGFRRHERIL